MSKYARCARAITLDGVYKVFLEYAVTVGIDVEGFGPHTLRATAATNALEHDADMYNRLQTRAEDSPTFKVVY